MTSNPHILLVDDDSAFRGVYSALLTHAGFTVHQAHDRPSARDAFAARAYGAVLLDLMLPPDGSATKGLEMLSEFLAEKPGAKIIVASGAGDTRFMLQAVREGAYDFLTKPVDPDVIEVVMQRAVTLAGLEARVETLQNKLAAHTPQHTMIGQSPIFLEALQVAERVALADLPVLVSGEHGTGKELLARFIHEQSPRRSGPFVAVNCGALPENLLESTLFGHLQGSFTGAAKDRAGLFARAHQGTLFLDEIADMPAPLQVKVLRAIEYGEVLPVGADEPVQVDVRVLSATNKDLTLEQASGAFREDLYWRIRGAEICLPPLRERPEDVALLARHFLNLAAAICPDGQPRSLSSEAEELLVRHDWPGNMRELRHEMQRASVMAGARQLLTPEDFNFSAKSPASKDALVGDSLQEKIRQLEQREIRLALQRHQHNRTHVAQELGLSRQGLLNKMERYGIA